MGWCGEPHARHARTHTRTHTRTGVSVWRNSQHDMHDDNRLYTRHVVNCLRLQAISAGARHRFVCKLARLRTMRVALMRSAYTLVRLLLTRLLTPHTTPRSEPVHPSLPLALPPPPSTPTRVAPPAPSRPLPPPPTSSFHLLLSHPRTRTPHAHRTLRSDSGRSLTTAPPLHTHAGLPCKISRFVYSTRPRDKFPRVCGVHERCRAA